MVALVTVLGVLSGMKLMKIQIVESEEESESEYARGDFTFTRSVSATRGEIIDFSGNTIVASDNRCDAVLQKAFFPEDFKEGNKVLLAVYNALLEHGYKFEESFPVSEEWPYQFTEKDKEKAISVLKLNVYATAENCVDKLISDYQISDSYTVKEQRIIAGMRYEMLVSDFSYSNDIVLARNIDENTVVDIKELSNLYRGINVVESADRRIVRGDILPHEIGTVGPIYAEEYEELKEKGYALNDEVGKSGIELAMEKQLRGVNGSEKVTVKDGAVVDIKTVDEIISGQTVKLTVDGAFQLKLQGILDNFLVNFNNYGLAKKGAVVVLDTRTGAVKGMATAPTYNLKDYVEDYESLQELPDSPMFDRCTYGLYLPGSTFKTITATAGMNEGVVTGDTTLYCNQIYNFHGYPFSCTGWHGNIGVSHAIEVSCNCYFYELSSQLGIDNITKYAKLYGLGESTGIETGDAEGFLCNPETFAERNQPWYIGYVIQAGIGNQDCGFTPLQLAVVASTIANRGIRYKPYLVDSLYTYGSNELIKKTEPKVAGKIELNYAETYNYIISGMMAAANNMPAQYTLSDLGYSVAIKTGTPQTDQNDLSKQNSLFIGFAPADNPEVAFAGVIEGGEFSKYMIRDILLAYQECYGINGSKPTATLPPENRPSETTTTATETSLTTTSVTTAVSTVSVSSANTESTSATTVVSDKSESTESATGLTVVSFALPATTTQTVTTAVTVTPDLQ